MNKSGTIHSRFYCPYLGAMQVRSKACHKEVIIRSQQVVVQRPLKGNKFCRTMAVPQLI